MFPLKDNPLLYSLSDMIPACWQEKITEIPKHCVHTRSTMRPSQLKMYLSSMVKHSLSLFMKGRSCCKTSMKDTYESASLNTAHANVYITFALMQTSNAWLKHVLHTGNTTHMKQGSHSSHSNPSASMPHLRADVMYFDGFKYHAITDYY